MLLSKMGFFHPQRVVRGPQAVDLIAMLADRLLQPIPLFLSGHAASRKLQHGPVLDLAFQIAGQEVV